jgi:hypothetical protein
MTFIKATMLAELQREAHTTLGPMKQNVKAKCVWNISSLDKIISYSLCTWCPQFIQSKWFLILQYLYRKYIHLYIVQQFLAHWPMLPSFWLINTFWQNCSNCMKKKKMLWNIIHLLLIIMIFQFLLAPMEVLLGQNWIVRGEGGFQIKKWWSHSVRATVCSSPFCTKEAMKLMKAIYNP